MHRFYPHLLLAVALSQVVTCTVHESLPLAGRPVRVLTPRHEIVHDRNGPPPQSCLSDNFHYPHHCKTPFCTFMVAWREDEGGETVTFDLTAKVEDTHMVWAAIGFSGDTRMGDTDAVICYMTSDGQHEIHLGLIQPEQPRIVKVTDNDDDGKGNLVLHSIQVKDKKLHCSFSRKKSITDVADLHDIDYEWKSLGQEWHILMATGRLVTRTENNQTTYVMQEHSKKAASGCKCNVTSCAEECDCPDGLRYQLVKLHGVLMSVAFIFFIPTGALISRYYKMVFSTSWFKGHIAMMVIGVLWALIGFFMVLGHTRGEFKIGIHQIVGITCLFLVCIQPIVALLRPPAGPPITIRRILFNAFHRTMAIFILTTSCVALFMGTYIFCNALMTWIMSILGLFILVNVGFILLLEILTRTHKFSTAPPVGYHKVTKHDDLSESEEEVFVRDDPNKKTKSGGKGSPPQPAFKMEKTLLIMYIVQAFGFAILVAALLYYFDSHKHGD